MTVLTMTGLTAMGATTMGATTMGAKPTAAMQTVSDDEADIRLDRWFRRHFPGVPQSAIQKLCRTGQIRVDGKRAEAATRLASGQAVRIPPLPAAPPAKPRIADPAATRENETK